MRPAARWQSALKCPLNNILRTESSIRVLRVLMLSRVPVAVAGLARRTRLEASGVARACARLEELGVIEAVGREYQAASRFPLGDALRGLFVAERARSEQLVGVLRRLIRDAWGRVPAVCSASGRIPPLSTHSCDLEGRCG